MAGGVCHKKTAALLWTLLECVFFSGVVLAWSWLALILQSDGYFLHHCPSNSTNSSSNSPTVIPDRTTAWPLQQGYVTKRRCLQRHRVTQPPTEALVPRPRGADEPTTAVLPSLPVLFPQPPPTPEPLAAALFAQSSSSLEPTGRFFSQVYPTHEPTASVFSQAPSPKPTSAHFPRTPTTPKPTAAFQSYPPGISRPTLFLASRPQDDAQNVGDDRSATQNEAVNATPVPASSSFPSSMSLSPLNDSWSKETGSLRQRRLDPCVEQMERLRVLFAVVNVLRDALVLPIGAFMDKFGTTRTRLLSVLIFATGTLMMTFTSSGVPWLVVPALTLTGVAGMAVLLTNLQVANLFGTNRHLVVAMYCGASLSSGLITYLMQLSHWEGVNVQTSFMFLTIGLVPMLVSTVAFLPKTRIPWPLPDDYGKRRHQSLDENVLRKQRAWQRRLSEAGLIKLRRPSPRFWPTTTQRLFVGTVMWHSVHALHVSIMETRVVEVGQWSDPWYTDLEHFGWLQLLGIVLAPLPGLLLDKRPSRKPVASSLPLFIILIAVGVKLFVSLLILLLRDLNLSLVGMPVGTQQMQNVVPAILVTSLLAALELVTSVPAVVSTPMLSFFFHISHRVFHLTTSLAILMHVHFPQDHLGKYVGLMLMWTAILGTTQFPIKVFFHHQQFTIVPPVHVALLLQILLTMAHAVNVWNCCRRRLIRDQPAYENAQHQQQRHSVLHAYEKTELTSHHDNHYSDNLPRPDVQYSDSVPHHDTHHSDN